MTIYLVPALPSGSRDLPAPGPGRTGIAMRTTSRGLLDLASGGVYKLPVLPPRLVVSYTTVSPLPYSSLLRVR